MKIFSIEDQQMMQNGVFFDILHFRVVCPATWDGILCWNSAAPGNVLNQQCPTYFVQEPSSHFPTRMRVSLVLFRSGCIRITYLIYHLKQKLVRRKLNWG